MRKERTQIIDKEKRKQSNVEERPGLRQGGPNFLQRGPNLIK